MAKEQKLTANEKSKITNILGVVSGKGGVGKSYVTSIIAVALAKQGFTVGILDADITGPSIPHQFDINGGLYGDEVSIYPALSKRLEIKIISASLLLSEDDDPIMWRGPLVGDLVTQFFTTTSWGELDYLLIDFPPGTSDVALSAFSQIPLTGIVLVTTPQEIVQPIVKKTMNMAEQMGVKVYGVIENMAYVECPNCQEKIYLYGESNDKKKFGNLELLGSLPLQPNNTKLADEGKIEVGDTSFLEPILEKLIMKVEQKDD